MAQRAFFSFMESFLGFEGYKSVNILTFCNLAPNKKRKQLILFILQKFIYESKVVGFLIYFSSTDVKFEDKGKVFCKKKVTICSV